MEATDAMNANKSPLLLALLAFGFLCLLWDLAARYSGWSAQVFPGPPKVLAAMGELIAGGSLLKHSVASLFRVTAGFYLAILFGIPLGIVIGRMKTAKQFLIQFFSFCGPYRRWPGFRLPCSGSGSATNRLFF